MNEEIEKSELDDLKRAIAAEAARQAIYDRPFAKRHPELGKKKKCYVCGLKHYTSKVCVPVYARNEAGEERICSQTTKKGVLGAASVKGKRILPHINHRLLELVQRTRVVYEDMAQYFHEDPEDMMKRSRGIALAQLTRERNRVKKDRRRQQDVSRRINWGLLPGGTRP